MKLAPALLTLALCNAAAMADDLVSFGTGGYATGLRGQAEKGHGRARRFHSAGWRIAGGPHCLGGRRA